MKYSTSAVALAGLGMLAGFVSAKDLGAPEGLDAFSITRVDISQFRANDPTIFAEPVGSSGGAALGVCWDNGAPDDVTAHQSQETNIGDFYAADDLYVKAGDLKYIDEICVCFLVSDTIDGFMFKPVVGLNVYEDCNGRPDLTVPAPCVVAPQPIDLAEGITGINNGPSAAFPGFNEWEFCFDVDMFVFGDQRLWISPYGVAELTGPGGGLYFWRSANNGEIQGTQGQIKNGAEAWQDVQECDCPGICTDFCFQIIGDRCCLLKDLIGLGTTSGSMSIQRNGAIIDTARAAEDIQIPPGGDSVGLCVVAALVATNCPPDKFFLEIYENECDAPGAKLCTIDITEDADGDGVSDLPRVRDLGLDYLGCNIYELLWVGLPDVTLEPGRNYWISVVGRGTGSILDKAFWMHVEPGDPCEHICINEGVVKDPLIPGLEDWTPVSETLAKSTLHREFALAVGISAGEPAPPQPIIGACCLSQIVSGGPTAPLCQELSEGACGDLGGEFFEAQACSSVMCSIQQASQDVSAPTGAGPAPQRRQGTLAR